MRTFDPHFASANVDRSVADLVFNGLISFRPGNVNLEYVEPDLAESWEISADGLSWTFHLRKGVVTHPWNGNPGYELTSEDIVYSLQKAANPDRSAFAGEYVGMTFEALDDYTVRIVLDTPLSSLLFLAKVIDYAGGFIVPKRPIEDMGDDAFRTHPVGTGPFVFQTYVPMEKVVLVRNENYFCGTPILEQVELLYIADLSARTLGFRAGEFDVVEGPQEQAWVEDMEAIPDTIVDVFGPGSASVLHLNTSKPPFDDLRVRQAAAYALSRDELVAAIGSEVAEPIFSIVPAPYLPGGLSEEEVSARGLLYTADRNKARELLAEAGYPDGVDVEVYHTELAAMLRPMEAFHAQLAEAGINLILRVVDHSSFHSLIRQDASPIVHYMCWRPNADVFLTRFFHSDSIVVEGAKPDTNFSHYYQIDYAIEQARQATSASEQVAWWKEAQYHILEDVSAIPLFIKQFTFAHKSYVDYGYDFESNFNQFPPIREGTKILAH